MIKVIMGSLFALSFLVANSAYASEPEIDTCNNCTKSQVVAKAKQRYVSPITGLKHVYVFDYHLATAWYCEVYNEPGFPQNYAFCQPAPTAVQETFLEIADIVVAMNGNEVSIPYPGGNIYDISGCPACARQWLTNNGPAVANQLDLVDILAAAGLRLSGQIGVSRVSVAASYEGQIRVKVVLSNDSSGGLEQGYCIGYLTGTELAIDTNQCVDSDGNQIPTLQNPSISNTYLFTSLMNHRAMLNRLKSMGRTVIIHTGSTSIGPLTVKCSGDACESEEPEDSTDDQ